MNITTSFYARLLLACVITLITVTPISSYDVWWHVHSGVWMLENWQLMDTDVWTYTKEGAEFRNFAWLFQIILSVFYLIGDIPAMMVLKFLLVASTFYLLLAASLNQFRLTAAIFAIILLFPAINLHFFLRAGLIEVLSMAVLIYLAQQQWSRKHLIIAFVTLVIWANSHTSVIVGTAAIGLHILVGTSLPDKSWRERFLIAALFAIPPFLTPYGLTLITVLLDHANTNLSTYYIKEWFVRDSYIPGLWMAALVVIISGIRHTSLLKPLEWFFIIFFLYYSHKHVRFELELALALVRPLIASIAQLKTEFSKEHKQLFSLSLILVGIIHVFLFRADYSQIRFSEFLYQTHDQSRYPYSTTTFLNRLHSDLGRPLKVLNDYGYGGYISFMTRGNAKIYIDGRMTTLFDEKDFYAIRHARPDVLRRLMEEHQVDAILMRMKTTDIETFRHDHWQLVAYDPASYLFVRKSLLTNSNYPDIPYNPFKYQLKLYQQEALEDIDTYLTETRKVLETTPDNTLAINHLAFLLTNKASTAEVRNEIASLLKKSAALYPEDPLPPAALALLYARWTSEYGLNPKIFLDSLPTPEGLQTGIPFQYELSYANLLNQLGLHELALAYLYPKNKDRRHASDIHAETWALRSWAHYATGDIKEGKNTMDIAYALLKDNDDKTRRNLDKLQGLFVRQ